MKFAGFNNPNLNLGFVEVALVSRNNVHVLSCSSCGFTCAKMHIQMCGHTRCDRCLVRPLSLGEVVPEKPFYCSACDLRVLAMPMTVQEDFLLNLHCHCPRCKIQMKIGELSTHLDVCIDLDFEETPVELGENPVENDTDEAALGITNFFDNACRQNNLSQKVENVDPLHGLQMRVLREELLGKLCAFQNTSNDEIGRVRGDLIKEKQEILDHVMTFFPTQVDVTLKSASSASIKIDGFSLQFSKNETNVVLRVELSPIPAPDPLLRKTVTVAFTKQPPEVEQSVDYNQTRTIELKSGNEVIFEECNSTTFTAMFANATDQA